MNVPKIPAGRRTIKFLKLAYQANVPPLLIGGHGIGKSEMCGRAAAELGIDFIDRDLSILEPPDLAGIPEIDVNDGVTVYRPPSFLPRDGKGLLLLEELNRCPRYMRAPCLQFLTARRLNDYTLPAGWLPAACVNPSDEAYEVFELDPALLSRFMVANIVPDQPEWLRWAGENHVHPDVLAYVGADSEVFSEADSDPRSWTYVSKLLSLGETDKRTLRTGIESLIGIERTAAFLGFLSRPTKPLSAADVMSRKAHAETLRGWLKEGRVDLVESTLTNVLAHLQSANNVRRAQANPRYRKNLGLFFDQLPGDLRERAEKHLQDHGHPMPTANGSRNSG